LFRTLARVAGISACCTCATGLVHAAEPSKEYEVKAAYLYNFANFASWPVSAFDGDTAPFRICTAGQNPFGSALDDTVRGERVGQHPLSVVRVTSPAEVKGCHILFVPASISNAASYVAAVGGAPVLTIGEGDRFLSEGGALRFVLDNGRVRFDANAKAAAAAGINLTSRLLQVARQVQQ